MKATEYYSDSGYKVERYAPSKAFEWNEFVSKSKNATFLFHRDFMEYHKDRFEDFSLMVYKNEKLKGIFPANRTENTISSHQGLTYGGLLLLKDINFKEVEEMFESLLAHLKANDIDELLLKSMPSSYASSASNELSYLMLRVNSELYRRDIEMMIDYSLPLRLHKTKLKHFNKTKSFEFEIKEAYECDNFWNHVLVPKLKDKYDSNPVHTLEEIQFLKSKFPKNIHQYDVYFEGEIIAGITLFETEQVVKSQYGATTLKGEELRALEYLFIHLIYKYQKKGKRFFSMGTVNELNEMGYSAGLLKQKEELGCSVYLQDFYRLTLQ